MRVPLLVGLLLGGAAVLALLPAPSVQAAPSSLDGVFCGQLLDDTMQFFGADEYCVFQGLEVVDASCSAARDVTYREWPLLADPPANDPAGRPPGCSWPFLNVSGESSAEYQNDREWTQIAFLRFPDWHAKLRDKIGAGNISVEYAFVQLYYDDEYYTRHPEMVNAKEGTLFLTDLAAPMRPDLTWRQIQTDPDSWMNYTSDDDSRRSWLADGGFSGPFGGLPTPDGCGSDSASRCRMWVIDDGPFNTDPDFDRSMLDDVVSGRTPKDFGFAIAHGDFFASRSGSGSPMDDYGVCEDPTHVGTNPYVTGPPAASPPAESTCMNVFRSASWPGLGASAEREECLDEWIKGTGEFGSGVPGLQGEKKWPCWPRLVVHFSRNEPIVEQAKVTYNRTHSYLGQPVSRTFTSQVPLNLSIDVFEPRGEIRSVAYTIETSVVNSAGQSESRVVVPERAITSRAYNGSSTRAIDAVTCHCEKWRYWVRAPLVGADGQPLPNGKYWLNLTIEDSDHNRLEWPGFAFTHGNLQIDNTPPGVTEIAIADAQIEHKEQLAVSATVRSPLAAGANPVSIETAWVEVRAPTTDGSPGALVKALKAAPVDVDSFRQGRWSVSHAWGKFDFAEPPGTYHLWVRANDTMGRETRAFGGALHVVDRLDPEIQAVRVLTPQTASANVFLQEEGGPVRVEVDARDPENPVAPTVRVRLEAPGKVPIETTLARSGDSWKGSVPAPAAGTWTGRVVARDADGNEGTSTFTLVSLVPTPPVVRAPRPTAWSNLTPDVAVEVFDHTANASRIRLFVGEPGAATERSPVVSGAAPLLSVRAPALGTLRHNRTIEIRVEATDDLGLKDTYTWTFRVDAVPPAPTQLEVGAPKDERAGRTYVQAATPFSLAGSDGESGLASLRWRLTDLSRNLTGEWRAYAGPFTLGDADAYRAPGAYRLEWRATDRAGNQEAMRAREIHVDSAAPTLQLRFDGLGFDVVGEDQGSGLASVTIWHRNGTSAAWTELALAIADPSRLEDRAPIPAVPRGARAFYYATAIDRVGNTVGVGSLEKPIEAVSPNHAPSLDAVLPDEQATLAGLVHVRYTAPDADGDAVRIVLQLRPLVLPEARTLATISSEGGTLTWNTSEWPDGPYELTIVANDGTASSTQTVRVEVRNTASGVFDPSAPRGRVELRDALTFTVTLYKPVREATLQVLDDEKRVVATVALRDDGKDGDAVAGDRVFTALYVPTKKGAFTAVADLQYENEAATKQDLGSFTVETTLVRSLARNAVPIALGVLVAIGVGAAVVVQLMRYGYLFPRED